MKSSYLILCILLITTSALQSDSSRENTLSVAKDGGTEIKGCLGGRRTKRGIISKIITLSAATIKGLHARKKLLKGLTPVKKDGSVTFYNKNGGFADMIDDFYAVDPTNVRASKVNGETVAGVGRVGDRMIFYNTSSPSREIVLLKMKQNGEIIMCDVIKYGTIEI